MSEIELALVLALHVEAFGVGVLALVATRRARHERDARTGRDRDAVPDGIAQGDAALELRRRLVAQRLLDRVGNPTGIVPEILALIGVLPEQVDRVAEQ